MYSRLVRSIHTYLSVCMDLLKACVFCLSLFVLYGVDFINKNTFHSFS